MDDSSWFFLKVYAEDGVFFEGKCLELVLPLPDGEKAFLAHHEDAVYAVYNGTMRFLVPREALSGLKKNNSIQDLREEPKEGSKDGSGERSGKDEHGPVWLEAVIGTGVTYFVNNRCVVLSETAERPEDIDAMRAQRALERAQEKMQQKLSMREYRISQMAMARATARIRAANRREEKN